MTTLFNHRSLGGRAARASALCLLALAAALVCAREARAQWTTSGTNTTTTNNVGVGTAAPATSLHVSSATAGTTRGIVNEQTSADSNSALFFFRKSRAGAAAQNGDNVGSLFGSAFDGAGFVSSARLRFAIDGPVSVGSMPIALQFLTGSTGEGVERMRISSGGYVGIGTAAPPHTLSVSTPAGIRSGLSLTGDGNPYVYTDLHMAPATTSTIPAGKPVNFAWSVRKDAYYGGDASGPSMVMEIWRQGGGAYVPFIINPSGNLILAGATNATNGNVGVGTLSPVSPLTVNSDTNVSPLLVSGNNSNVVGMVVSNSQAGSKAWALQVAGASNLGAVPNGSLILRQATDNLNPVVISKTGDMGVGVAAPVSKLHVAGNITVDGNINAKYQDVAEWVPSTQELHAGTVVILDTGRDNHVVASNSAYDTRVAGVISARPGLSLGEAGDGKVLVATTGRVKVRVDATRSPIKIGDLIVTSDVAGVAMKSEPVSVGGVAMHRPGTLIGKALESLEKGTGEILVLLSLQ